MLEWRVAAPLGLVASTVLRCNDRVNYRLGQYVGEAVTGAELDDAVNMALVVGGFIVILHLRHVVEPTDLLRARAKREAL